MNFSEKTIKRQEIFSGEVISVHVDEVELKNGNKSTREVVEHRGGVCVAAITKEKEILFVEQYRYPYSKSILELPAGKLEVGQTPLENGVRELKEEVGAVGKNYTFLGELYPSPGYCGEVIYMYYCVIEEIGDCCPDEDEFLNIVKIPLSKAVDMIISNKVFDAKTQVIILKLHVLDSLGKLF